MGIFDFLFGSKPQAIQGVPDTNALVGQYNRQFGAANRANRRRYRQLLGLMRQSMTDVGTRSGQNVADIQREGADLTAQGDQSLMNRGLYNTSTLDALHRNIGFDTAAAVNREHDFNIDRLINRRDALGNAISNRQDVGPDAGFYANVISQAGGAQRFNANRRRSGGVISSILGGNLF